MTCFDCEAYPLTALPSKAQRVLTVGIGSSEATNIVVQDISALPVALL